MRRNVGFDLVQPAQVFPQPQVTNFMPPGQPELIQIQTNRRHRRCEKGTVGEDQKMHRRAYVRRDHAAAATFPA